MGHKSFGLLRKSPTSVIVASWYSLCNAIFISPFHGQQCLVMALQNRESDNGSAEKGQDDGGKEGKNGNKMKLA